MSWNTSAATAITPEQIAQLITLPVEQASVALGVSTIIASNDVRTRIPRLTADPAAAWVAEGAEIGASDPTVDDITVTPSKLAGLNVVSNELAADSSPAAQQLVGAGLARDIAKKLDAAFFGKKGSDPVRPAGLEDLTGFTPVDAGEAWANLDPFEDAKIAAEGLGLKVTNFVANPADVLALSKLKESSTSNRGLLTPDATAATNRTIAGVPLLVSSAVTAGTIWGIPAERSVIVRRQDVSLATDTSAYFTSDRTAIRATLRIGFAFPQPAALVKIKLSA